MDDIFLATNNKELIARFLESDFVRDLPERHHRCKTPPNPVTG
ncbi:MAG: hypothetical protein R3F51_17290 [Cyanobacteriota/Melainabacteria group bacterium]